jgi:hypothetical protein
MALLLLTAGEKLLRGLKPPHRGEGP